MYPLMLSGNPLLQLVGLAVGAVVAVGAILLGAVVLAFFLGFAVIAGTVFYIRFWWLARQRGRSHPQGGEIEKRRRGGGGTGEIFEAEYTVINERAVRDRGRD